MQNFEQAFNKIQGEDENWEERGSAWDFKRLKAFTFTLQGFNRKEAERGFKRRQS